ncbi:SCP2 domain-containing protein [Undibacterium piscinae]|jgi:predicted lipid carrier protein YhbT|uniref:SCP2 domain-containing protein n=1 Tax=Undibacterium piscinae TaxID=2495591 RepID=A0A6M4A1Q4_9BURK|nr:SCP2 domain-containing protein [Undibacterium piscinae]
MQLSDFRFPSAFSQIGKYIPSPLASLPLLAMLELARRREWLLAPETLYGKSFLIVIEDLGLQLRFVCDQGKFKPQMSPQSSAAPADVRLSALAVDFFQLASGMEDADTLFFRRRLKMEGDTELGVAVKYWLDASERPAWLNNLADKLAS